MKYRIRSRTFANSSETRAHRYFIDKNQLYLNENFLVVDGLPSKLTSQRSRSLTVIENSMNFLPPFLDTTSHITNNYFTVAPETDEKLHFLWLSWSGADIAGLAVALATLVLAYFAKRTIDINKQLIGGEDRRHQQSLAPLVEFSCFYDSRFKTIRYFELFNNGTGIALNLEVKINIMAKVSKTLLTPLTPEEIALSNDISSLPSIMKGGSISKSPEGIFRATLEPGEPHIHFDLAHPSLLPNGTSIQIGADEFESYREEKKIFEIEDLKFQITISYTDVFNNPYKTIYEGPDLKKYIRIIPKYLR